MMLGGPLEGNCVNFLVFLLPSFLNKDRFRGGKTIELVLIGFLWCLAGCHSAWPRDTRHAGWLRSRIRQALQPGHEGRHRDLVSHGTRQDQSAIPR